MAKEQDLGYATRMQSEQSDEPSTEQFEEVDHPGKATALLACASPEEIFLSGTDGSENVSRLVDHGRRGSAASRANRAARSRLIVSKALATEARTAP